METRLLTYVVGECADCGEEIVFGQEYESDRYGKVVCADCYDRNGWCHCYDCGELICEDDQNYVSGERAVCEDCLGDNYFRCECCDEWFPNDESNTVYDRNGWEQCVCDDCLNSEYTRCECCDEYHEDGSLTHVSGYGYVCGDCLENGDFRECDNCGRYYHYEDGEWDANDECWYCNNCVDCHGGSVRVMGYHTFGDFRYRPRFSPDEIAAGKVPLLFGVELECDRGSFVGEDFKRWAEDGDLVHFEHDGSLSNRGVELITQPCSLSFHQNHIGWKDLTATLLRQGFRSHDTEVCGLHVHVGRKGLAPTTIVKMDVFVNRASAFFSRLARREVFYHSRYDPNKLVDARKARRTSGDRYTAVNTTNEKTVEIRIFKGTLRAGTVIGTIELVHAMVKFLDSVPIARIYDRDLVERFVRYVCENMETYPECVKMMARLLEGVSAFEHEHSLVLNAMEKLEKKGVKECA